MCKSKFRSSKEWKQFRLQMKESQRIDPISNKPLTKRFHLHHKDLNEDNYCNLIVSHFVCLNPTSHDLIHYLYNIIKREQSYEVLNRIKNIIEDMRSLNDCKPIE